MFQTSSKDCIGVDAVYFRRLASAKTKLIRCFTAAVLNLGVSASLPWEGSGEVLTDTYIHTEEKQCILLD